MPSLKRQNAWRSLAAHYKVARQLHLRDLFAADPRRGERLSERWSLQGNPSLREDWATEPDGGTVDFLAFARTEGRFAGHFGPGGAASPEILATQADRLGNWRMLQELAGLR